MEVFFWNTINFNVNTNACIVQEAEQKAAARADKQEAREAHAREVAAAAEAAAYAEAHPAKSPSDFSCQSYELFVNQERGAQDDNTRERMSLRSDPFQDSVSTQPTHKPDSHHDARRPRKVSMVSICNYTQHTRLPTNQLSRVDW